MFRKALRAFGRYLVTLTEQLERDLPSKATPRANTDTQFSSRAKRLAQARRAGGQAVLAGSIGFLGLDEIKQELGANWPNISAAADHLIQDAIERHLSPDDTYIRRGEDTIVLCFATPDRNAVEGRMQAIAQEIRYSLQRITQDDIFRVVHDVADVEFVDSNDEPIIETISRSLQRVRAETENAARTWRQHLIRSAILFYKPVWAPRKQVIALHRAVLDDETGRRTVQRLATLSSADEMRTILFEIDTLILGRAAVALHDLISNGGRTQLIIPVYFSSLETRQRRNQYLKTCDAIPDAYRRFILFEAHDIPRGTPGTRVADLSSALNTYANGVIIETDISLAHLPRAMGVAGVVTQPPSSVPQISDEDRLLAHFVSTARSASLKTFLYRTDTRRLLEAAAAAGVDYLQGTAIAKPTKDLKTVYPWYLSDSL